MHQHRVALQVLGELKRDYFVECVTVGEICKTRIFVKGRLENFIGELLPQLFQEGLGVGLCKITYDGLHRVLGSLSCREHEAY